MRRPFISRADAGLGRVRLGLIPVAASATPPGDTPDTGNFYMDPASFSEGQTVKLTANFPAGTFMVTFLQADGVGHVDVDRHRPEQQLRQRVPDNYQVNGTQDLYARITSGGDGSDRGEDVDAAAGGRRRSDGS